jgi:hypothetical protein
MCEGFSTVELVPSPKFHFHEVGDSVLLSVNVTFSGEFPDVGDAEKAALGAFRGAFTAAEMGSASAVADNNTILINTKNIFCLKLILISFKKILLWLNLLPCRLLAG